MRVFYGDSETGRAWNEEYDVCGTIGRSMGTSKIPLMIANSRSLGGPGLLDNCIVAVMHGLRFVYKHPKFIIPQYDMTKEDIPDGYTVGVDRDGNRVANFRTEKQARRWIAFMQGERRGK